MSSIAAVQQILEAYKPVWAIDHATGLLEWDLEVYMPENASKPRGFAFGQLALMKQKHIVDAAGLVSKAQSLGGGSDFDKGVLRLAKREVNYYTKLPPELVEALNRTTTEATVVWREARRKSDFAMFKPWLEKIVGLKRQEAEKLGYVGHPYNALLDRFEEELTVTDVDRVFSMLVPGLKRILGKIQAEGKFLAKHPLEFIKYEEEWMRAVNQEVLPILNMPKKNFRLDVSTHPFTSGMAIEDVRVTTRYEGISFKETVFSLIHECGHALYDLQVDPALEYTPLSRGASLGVHESQSRFWENIIGRSREFTKLIYPILKKHLPFLKGYSEEDVYKYFNMVRPSPIRVDADELTYNFHIVLRYEIEKKIIDGSLGISEIPAYWMDKMEEFVGFRPKNDAEGALQDVHWGNGYFGYFPTYSLGNVIGGMILNRIQKDLNLGETVKSGKLDPIKTWLRDNIHKYGATYSPKELQARLFSDAYNPQPLLGYLEQKFLA